MNGPENVANAEAGLVGKMMMFLRNDIAEIHSAADRLEATADGLFGGGAGTPGSSTGSGATPSHAVAEMMDLMEQAAMARNRLHDQVNRLTGQL